MTQNPKTRPASTVKLKDWQSSKASWNQLLDRLPIKELCEATRIPQLSSAERQSYAAKKHEQVRQKFTLYFKNRLYFEFAIVDEERAEEFAHLTLITVEKKIAEEDANHPITLDEHDRYFYGVAGKLWLNCRRKLLAEPLSLDEYGEAVGELLERLGETQMIEAIDRQQLQQCVHSCFQKNSLSDKQIEELLNYYEGREANPKANDLKLRVRRLRKKLQPCLKKCWQKP